VLFTVFFKKFRNSENKKREQTWPNRKILLTTTVIEYDSQKKKQIMEDTK